jgi:hypothetical protein
MASQSRKHRGMRTQLVVTQWFQARGWPFAESTGAGRSGVDVTGMPGLAPEVKARNDFNLTGFLKQAVSNRGDGLPFVVVRPNGYGETRVGDWGVVMTLDDLTTLLRLAGFGNPELPDIDIHTEQA